jgi:cellulose synthase/poly-beta-1,6-N-acetylglucosamine synthase-like glycosyltransferase
MPLGILHVAYTCKGIYREVPLSWNNFVRQSHRWLSIAFTLTVVANVVAIATGRVEQPPGVVTYSPLLPLALLLFSGLYLFVLPYTIRWRSGRRTSRSLSA